MASLKVRILEQNAKNELKHPSVPIQNTETKMIQL